MFFWKVHDFFWVTNYSSSDTSISTINSDLDVGNNLPLTNYLKTLDRLLYLVYKHFGIKLDF